ncbi:MAG: hypothetical protein AB1756_00350 [Acidobacteriota bacterium]
MKKVTFKQILLVIVAVTFFVVLYFQVSQYSLFGGKPKAVAKSVERGLMKENPIRYDVPALRIDLLAHNSAVYDPAGRNLFNYDKPKPTPQELEEIRKLQEEAQRRAEEERKRREAEEKIRVEEERKEAERRALLPPPPPPAPPINFKFIGYLGKPEDKIAVLEEGKDLYFGKEGETVKDQFMIIKIDFDSLVMGYVRDEWRDQKKVLPFGK